MDPILEARGYLLMNLPGCLQSLPSSLLTEAAMDSRRESNSSVSVTGSDQSRAATTAPSNNGGLPNQRQSTVGQFRSRRQNGQGGTPGNAGHGLLGRIIGKTYYKTDLNTGLSFVTNMSFVLSMFGVFVAISLVLPASWIGITQLSSL